MDAPAERRQHFRQGRLPVRLREGLALAVHQRQVDGGLQPPRRRLRHRGRRGHYRRRLRHPGHVRRQAPHEQQVGPPVVELPGPRVATYTLGNRSEKFLQLSYPRQGLVAAFERTRFCAGGGRLTLVGGSAGEADVPHRPFLDIHPSCTQAELEGLLAAARVLVQPSLEEGFGLPVQEAMAAGVPLAISKIRHSKTWRR